jgi:DNA-binding transcriptional regulator GbsR (MarR family)
MTEAVDSTVTVEDLAEVITEFEKYRDRLVDETVETAKKAKISKQTVMTQLQPQLEQIDSKLEVLRAQYNEMIDG